MKKKGWGGHDPSNESENGKDVLRKLKKNAEKTGALGQVKKTNMDPDSGSQVNPDGRKDGYPKNTGSSKK